MEKFKSLFKSEFAKNVSTLVTGTTIAQAIPVAISPILTRLYTPEDFGVLAVFISLTAVFSSVANGKYELAIMLPKSNEDASNIFYLCCLNACIISTILFIIIIIFRENITELLGEPKIKPWLYLLPVSVFFIGLFNALNLFNVRLKKYKSIAYSSIYKSSGMGVTQLVFGVSKFAEAGLIIGQLTSFLVGNFILFRNLRLVKLPSIKFAAISHMSKKFINFPKFTLPSSLLNALTLNLINFLIASIYSTTILGFYSISKRMVGIPSMVLGGSISQVYFQKLTEIKNNEGDVNQVFTSTLKKLSYISIPIFIFAFFTVQPIFIFVFGSEWQVAGEYARVIIPLAWIRFLSSTLSVTNDVFQRQKILLIFNISLMMVLILSFIVCSMLDKSFYENLIIYSVGASILYLTLLIASWKTIQNFKKKY